MTVTTGVDVRKGAPKGFFSVGSPTNVVFEKNGRWRYGRPIDGTVELSCVAFGAARFPKGFEELSY